jgi:hypothetical protein
MLSAVMLSVVALSMIVVEWVSLCWVALCSVSFYWVSLCWLVMLNHVMLSVIILCVLILSTIMLSVVMLNDVVLSVVILSVLILTIIMLNVAVLSVVILDVTALTRFDGQNNSKTTFCQFLNKILISKTTWWRTKMFCTFIKRSSLPKRKVKRAYYHKTYELGTKPRSLPYSGAPERYFIQVGSGLIQNIRLGWKGLPRTNTPAY